MTNKLYSFASIAHLFAVTVLFATGCSTPTSKEKDAGNKAAYSDIGLAYALGGKGDQSYNDAADRGAGLLRAQGYQVREFEPSTLDDYTRGLDLLSVRNPNLVFCVGFLYDDPVQRIAAKHPRTKFFVLDGSAAVPANVGSIKFNAEEGSFLAGAVAGTLTKSGTIAFVGGANIPIINEFLQGYRNGARFVRPDVKVSAHYVGSGGASFTDPVKGREVGLSAISQGADVLFHAAGSSGNGMIKAAQEKGVLAIGVDVDQYHIAPGTVVTSMMKNFDRAMFHVVQQLQRNALDTGSVHSVGLKEGAVALAPINHPRKAELEAVVERARQQVLARTETPR